MLDKIWFALSAAMTDRKGISSLEYIVLAVGILAGLLAATQALTPKLSVFFATTIPGYL